MSAPLSQFAGGAVQAAGNKLMTAALNTPQGHAAVVGAATLAVAVAPVVLTVAIAGGVVVGTIKALDWLFS